MCRRDQVYQAMAGVMCRKGRLIQATDGAMCQKGQAYQATDGAMCRRDRLTQAMAGVMCQKDRLIQVLDGEIYCKGVTVEGMYDVNELLSKMGFQIPIESPRSAQPRPQAQPEPHPRPQPEQQQLKEMDEMAKDAGMLVIESGEVYMRQLAQHVFLFLERTESNYYLYRVKDSRIGAKGKERVQRQEKTIACSANFAYVVKKAKNTIRWWDVNVLKR